ncbi:MAG TPA: alkaline phosphatase, partial [Prolixibacteraceae bacterium]|nr:alkaline phosphatase [Prolixibacteraceae bacterium]
LFTLMVFIGAGLFAQNDYLDAQAEPDEKVYTGGESYQVKQFPQKFRKNNPKNIILMIGDGMGVAQVFAGLTANQGNLYLKNFKNIGFSTTHSADKYITDSAAGGTALSAGVKTNNGAIGVDPDGKKVKTILEEAEEKGLSTGLVSTSSITHATPASFIAHQVSRNMYEEIAADFLNTDFEVLIGGGKEHFTKRKDQRNLVEELSQKGYVIKPDLNKIGNVKGDKLVCLTADKHNPRMAERADMLPVATKTAVNLLSQNKKGFFLMVEGSQIDWGGHAKSTIYIVEDMLDFDRAIGQALEFAADDGKTLVIVTADHETGGMAITGGDLKTGMVKADYPTGGHTGIMVPVFAYGPGAEEFTGIMDNTDIYKKMNKLLIQK